MFRKIVLSLSLTEEEHDALMRSAAADIREMRDQARYLLREQLEQRGFLENLLSSQEKGELPEAAE